jgi:hypothetical protein
MLFGFGFVLSGFLPLKTIKDLYVWGCKQSEEDSITW